MNKILILIGAIVAVFIVWFASHSSADFWNDWKGQNSNIYAPAQNTGTNQNVLPENSQAQSSTPATSINTTSSSATAGCIVTGCSREICSDKEQVTACIYQPSYQCYATAKCERQKDGKCGWTQTTSLRSCLASTTRQ